MKKFLLFISFFVLAGLINSSYTQCTFSKAGIKLNGQPHTDPNTGKCIINLDFYFDLESNPGAKDVFVHIWPTSLYPDYSYAGQNPPKLAQLLNSVATVGFHHHMTELYLLTQYPPDPTIPNFQYQGLSVSIGPGEQIGYDRFTIHNIMIIAPTDCSVPQSFTADAWQTQSAQAQNVHCFSKGLLFYANDPTVSGFIICQEPRRYNFGISTISPSGMIVNYNVYIDDGDEVFNKTTDNILIASATNVSLNAGNNYHFSSGVLAYPPYDGQKPYSERSLWIEVTSTSIPNAVYGHLENLCAPLPVNLVFFTAARKNEMVQLKWSTASEAGNKGFYIERKNTTADWQTIAFVPALSLNGNSSEILNYFFTDNNTLKGISQYRLRQVDIDGEASYSVTRIVNGIEQTGRFIVFPNPATDGQLHFVLDNMSGVNIQMVDMSGHIMKAWNNISRNELIVNGLNSGIYVLKVWSKENPEPVSVKVFVNK